MLNIRHVFGVLYFVFNLNRMMFVLKLESQTPNTMNQILTENYKVENYKNER